MSSSTYGAIKLATAEEVGTILKKKMGTQTGYKPKDWADTINLLGKLPIRTASGSIAHFTDGAEDVPMKSVVANIVPIQEGTGDPSPSNPRPISGTSVLNVTRTGANLLDISEGEIGKWIDGSGNETLAGQGYVSEFIKTTGTTIKTNVFGQGDVSFFSCSICEYDKDKQFIRRDHHTTSDLSSEISDTLSNTTAFVKFQIYLNGGMTQTALDNGDIMVSFDSATTYEPYTGSTYTINLGRTVYGGNAEVVGGEGEETYGIVDLGDLTWTYRTDVLGVPCFLSNDISDIKNGSLPIACSCLEIKSPNRTAINGNYQVSIGNNTNAKYLVIRYDEYTDGTAVKTALTGQKLVYELATPTDFTFEGEEINSLEGVNNIYLDSGEVLDVEYRADIDLLISELGG